MAETVSIGCRIDVELKNAIDKSITEGRFRDLTDFIVKAIKLQLDPEQLKRRTIDDFERMLEYPEIQDYLEERITKTKK